MPLAPLGLRPGSLLSFAVVVTRQTAPHDAATTVAIERHPASHPIDVRVPAADFDAAHWRA
jgi:hypothetical protein